jgi:5'-nucleotidase
VIPERRDKRQACESSSEGWASRATIDNYHDGERTDLSSKPRILVTNDDGIDFSGIHALEAALSQVGEVYVAAPAREMSATSHSISLRRPITYVEVGSRRWAVDGTPADSVILALHRVLGFLPDMLFSGINPGGNLGRNVYYSGTVSAAIEGTLHGIPSVAVSLCSAAPFDFSQTGAFAARLAERIMRDGMPPGITLNLNVPPAWAGEVRVTRMGTSEAESLPSKQRRPHAETGDRVEPRESESPADHRLTTHGAAWRPLLTPDSDYAAVRDGAVSITPLILDRTADAACAALESWGRALAGI